jgi:hypothetical protein
MALPLPDLDTRRWTDLVDEGRALVPRYAPTWTDHNVHDPGVMLLELFAWLTEQGIYRLNQVPERHRLKFLSLIGFTPQGPQPARTVVAIHPEEPTPGEVPAGALLESLAPEGRPVTFRTLRALRCDVVRLTAVLTEERTGVWRESTADVRDGVAVAAFGPNPSPGAALYLGFAALPVQSPVSLAFRFEDPGTGWAERQRIVKETAAQRATCRPHMTGVTCPGGEASQVPSAHDVPLHHSARVVWEFSTGPDVWSPLQAVTGEARPDVGQVMDDTRSLTLDGVVELNLPSSATAIELSPVPQVLLRYVRVRLLSGAYDAPPLIQGVSPNGVMAEQAVPLWETFAIAPTAVLSGPPPAVGQVIRLDMDLDDSATIQSLTFDPPASERPDVVVHEFQAPSGNAVGRITLGLVRLGEGTGMPGQELFLPEAPVQAETIRVYTHAGNAWHEWMLRRDLDSSRRTDLHMVVDPTRGRLLAGDGERGRVIPAGHLVLAAGYSTDGSSGNLGAGTLKRRALTPPNAAWPLDPAVRIEQPALAAGGAAAETVAHASGRAVETLHAHERLVDLATEAKSATLDQIERAQIEAIRAPTRGLNLLDIERLVLDVPGTRIARARAWAGVHPAFACMDAPGVVTVVVLPDMPVARPQPSPGLLQAVRRYLDRRRVVCTRLEVVGPTYLEVTVEARVRVLPLASASRVRADVRVALDRFLDPRTGGPAGRGWPFGRDVYRSEVLQVIDGVAGVDHVLALMLRHAGGPARCGNVSLCPTWLVTPGPHSIEVA